ncbi:hypothetical protein SETIT_3G009000v2 [Setaria italica]|uniref:Uncharacterized protein n=1 Tax=Setaria italica TaxID=4555 RepID=A0A368QA53_SETIT|nr:hypothetical protein SETIT_3G009000v2 [Setaria italica]RCV14819.1 hypothetical protein SETIT_3G009000v2 [Setaria italica]RCV14820.1 hypothetical protein SETIT_3G009000v2 [Setaria italica]RCV14821.1 hypothetical protein SETIT_3G009000v2 [Setaria italica]
MEGVRHSCIPRTREPSIVPKTAIGSIKWAEKSRLIFNRRILDRISGIPRALVEPRHQLIRTVHFPSVSLHYSIGSSEARASRLLAAASITPVPPPHGATRPSPPDGGGAARGGCLLALVAETPKRRSHRRFDVGDRERRSWSHDANAPRGLGRGVRPLSPGSHEPVQAERLISPASQLATRKHGEAAALCLPPPPTHFSAYELRLACASPR